MVPSFRDFPEIKQKVANNETQDFDGSVLIKKEGPRISIGGLKNVNDTCF